MSDDDEYGYDFDASAAKSPPRPPKASPGEQDSDAEQAELDELQAENDRLAASVRQLKGEHAALEKQQRDRDIEWGKKVHLKAFRARGWPALEKNGRSRTTPRWDRVDIPRTTQNEDSEKCAGRIKPRAYLFVVIAFVL